MTIYNKLTFAAVLAAAANAAPADIHARQDQGQAGSVEMVLTELRTILNTPTATAPAGGAVGGLTVPGGNGGFTSDSSMMSPMSTQTPASSSKSAEQTMSSSMSPVATTTVTDNTDTITATTTATATATITATDTNMGAQGTQVVPIDTNFSPLPYSYNQEPTVNSARISSEASYASIEPSQIPGNTIAAQPVINATMANMNGPYTGGPASVTGAIGNKPANTSIPFVTAPPISYQPNGTLQMQEPIPFQPAGGLGTNGTEPVYRVQSDFDYQSILLSLYQEWIELDLFRNIMAKFNESDFAALNLTKSDMFLMQFMADQESGHSTLLSNMLGGPGGATPMCTYNYPFETLHEALDFSQILTRWGESAVLGFQAHLNSREVAQMLEQSISTNSRQQTILRQMSGLFPMPVWFETGIPQSWAWTYLAPYISSCPANSKRLAWQNFPKLIVLNQPNIMRWNASATGYNETVGFGPAAPSRKAADGDACDGGTGQGQIEGYQCTAAISQNRSIPLSYPGREVYLQWEAPGMPVGPNNSYVTSTTAKDPQYVVWVSQLNTTYSPLMDIQMNGSVHTGKTIQPDVQTFEGNNAINGTMFIGLSDTDEPYTPYNLSMINPHIAALGLYNAG